MRLLLVLPLLVSTIGCGASAVEAARSTLATSATAAVAADQAFGTAYGVASEAARASSTTQAEKDQKMTDWDRAADEMERAQSLARASLAAVEVVLDDFERTGDARYWHEALACAVQTLRDIAKVLEERGLHIPAALAKVLTMSAELSCAGGL